MKKLSIIAACLGLLPAGAQAAALPEAKSISAFKINDAAQSFEQKTIFAPIKKERVRGEFSNSATRKIEEHRGASKDFRKA